MPEFKDDIFSVTFGITFETTSVFSRFPVMELITSWPDDTPSCNLVVESVIMGIGLGAIITSSSNNVSFKSTVRFLYEKFEESICSQEQEEVLARQNFHQSKR